MQEETYELAMNRFIYFIKLYKLVSINYFLGFFDQNEWNKAWVFAVRKYPLGNYNRNKFYTK